MKQIWLEMLVQNIETWHMRIPGYQDLDRLLHSLTLRLILEINGNKYRTFKGDRKMYGPMPQLNENDRLYLTFTVLN